MDFPLETVETILDFIPYSPGRCAPHDPHHKHALLACAFVSRMWNAAARRCLLQQYFGSGHVEVAPTSMGIFGLTDIFQSPLCTLQPKFIKVLTVTMDAPPSLKLRDKLLERTGFSRPTRSFFVGLLALDPTLFSSLHTLIYRDTLLPSDESGNIINSCAIGSVLSQIKVLQFFESGDHVLFGHIVHTIRLCPFVEEVAARCWGDLCVDRSQYPHLLPPTSLKKLDVDMTMLFEFMEWFRNGGPNCTTIISLSVCGFEWGTHSSSPELQEFLDGVGQDLEELDLEVHNAEADSDTFVIQPHDEPLIQFTKNISLKRFVVRATPDVIAELLPYLFKHAHFAPRLETLEIVTSLKSSEAHIPLFSKFKWLDRHIRSRLSLSRIIVSYDRITQKPRWYERDRDEKWREVESQMRKYLPRCDEGHILEFKKSPWNAAAHTMSII